MVKKGKSIKNKQAFLSILSFVAVLIFATLAFLFFVYGLGYKSLPFIENNFTVLITLGAGLIFLLVTSYIVLFIFKKEVLCRLILFTLACSAIFAGVFYAISATGFIGKINSIHALRDYIARFGNKAILLYVLFCFLQVIILPIPGSVTVAAGVALFGPLKCILFSFIGIVSGSLVGFSIGRWLGYKAVKWIVGQETLDRWLNKLKGKDYLILSIMFLLPLFPDDVLCFVAGLSSMTWIFFLITIVVTRAISIVYTAYSFDLIPFNTWWGIMIWLILVALVVLSFWLVWKFSDKIDSFIKNKLKIKMK